MGGISTPFAPSIKSLISNPKKGLIHLLAPHSSSKLADKTARSFEMGIFGSSPKDNFTGDAKSEILADPDGDKFLGATASDAFSGTDGNTDDAKKIKKASANKSAARRRSGSSNSSPALLEENLITTLLGS